MIHVLWLLPAVWAGAVLGYATAAILFTAKKADNDMK